MNNSNKKYITNIYEHKFNKNYKNINKNNESLSENIFNNKYIIYFNKYSDKDEPLLYNFDGIIISKLKVLRILDNIINNNKDIDKEDILYSLIYNTLINKEDFIKLKNIIDNIE